MKKFLFVGLSCVGLIWIVNVSQNAQAQREKAEMQVVIQQVKQGNQNANATPTPGQGTMHVTQRVYLHDEGFIDLVLKLLRPGQ